MLSSKRTRTRAAGVLGPIARISVVALTLSAAGCSAEVTRFDSAARTPRHRSRFRRSRRQRLRPCQYAARAGTDRSAVAALATRPGLTRRVAGRHTTTHPPERPAPAPASAQPPGNYRVVGRKYKRAASASPHSEPPPELARVRGRRPTSLSQVRRRRHRGAARRNAVQHRPPQRRSRAAIKDANGLSSDAVRPGQRLVIPAGAQDRGPFAGQWPRSQIACAASIAQSPEQATANLDSAPAVEPPPGWDGRYTMRNGESLNGVAIRYRVSLEELKRANGITDPTKVWAGTVLNVPGEPTLQRRRAPSRRAAPRRGSSRRRTASTTRRPTKIASRGDIANDAEPAARRPRRQVPLAGARQDDRRFRPTARRHAQRRRQCGRGAGHRNPCGRKRQGRLCRQRDQGLRQPGADPASQRLGDGLCPCRSAPRQAQRRGAPRPGHRQGRQDGRGRSAAGAFRAAPGLAPGRPDAAFANWAPHRFVIPVLGTGIQPSTSAEQADGCIPAQGPG